MPYNTGNPVPSKDPRDLVDNAENMDEAVNGTGASWTDRLGNSRPTLKHLEDEYPNAGAEADRAEAAAEDAETAQAAAEAAQSAAETAETNAASSQSAAAGSASSAATSASDAQTYAEAAATAGDIYDDTTDGLAGTSEGDYFWVPSAVDGELLILYRHDSGPTATEFGRSSDTPIAARYVHDAGPSTLQAHGGSSLGVSTIIFQEPVTRTGKLQLTLRGGSATSTITVGSYTRSGKDFTKVADLGSVALAVDTETAFESTVEVEAGQHIALSINAQHGLAAVAPVNDYLPHGGHISTPFGLPVSYSGGTFVRTLVPQVKVEIKERIAVTQARALAEAGLARAFTGEGRFFSGCTNIYATGVGISQRLVVYDDACPGRGRLRMTYAGGTVDSTLQVMTFTRSGSTLTATGKSQQVPVTANTISSVKLSIDIEAGEYVGVFCPSNSISYISQIHDRGVGTYFSNGVESAPALQPDTNQYMFRFDLISDEDYARNGEIVVLGDSIINDTDREPFARALGDALGVQFVNAGIGGSTLCAGGDGSGSAVLEPYSKVSSVRLCEALGTGDWTTVDQGVIDVQGVPAPQNQDVSPQVNALKALDMNKVRLIVIQNGTNDYGNDYPLGLSTDTVATTFRGAINKIVSDIHSNYPWVEIAFITPVYRDRFTLAGDGLNSDIHPNDDGVMMLQYVDAEIEQAGINHVPCMDAYRTIGVNGSNAGEWLGDGLHPTSWRVHTRMGQRVAAWLKANTTIDYL